jgi:hypothetical protein
LMKRVLIMLMACVILIPALPASTAQPPASDAPYMYYYAPRLNAYVIERADGTDSRLFGKGMIDPETTYLTGPGWSPSGEWLAVVADNRWAGNRKWNSIVLNVNNEDRMTVLDDLNINWMEWVDGRDFLIASTEPETVYVADDRYEMVNYYLVDVPKDRLISHIQLDSISFGDQIYFEWLEDEKFSISYADGVTNTQKFIIGDLDGNIIRRTLPSENRRRTRSIPVSSRGWVLWNNIAINLLTLRTAIPETDRKMSVEQWSPNGTIGVAYCETGASISDSRCIFNVETLEVYEIGARDFFNVPNWSIDGQYLFLPRGLLDVYENLFIPFQPGINVNSIQKNDRWEPASVYEEIVFFDWDHLTQTRKLGVDLGSGERTITFQWLGINDAVYSADRQYVGYVDDASIITHVPTMERFIILPHSADFNHAGSSGGQILWHKTSNWFITFDDSDIVSSPLLIIANAETRTRRELSICRALTATCAGWLPDSVPLSQLPGGQTESMFPHDIPAPETIIPRDYWTWLLAWSEDGRYLKLEHDVYDISTGNKVLNSDDFKFPLQVESLGINAAFFIPEEHKFSFGHDIGDFLVTDLTSGEVIFRIPLVFNGAMSPTEQFLVTGSNADYIEFWNLTEGVHERTIPVTGSVFAFSPDGTKLAAGVSWEVWIWDVADLVGGEE